MYKKLTGEKAVVNFDRLYGKPKPTLSGLGVISSSILAVFVPAPNWISKFVGVVNLVTNLRGTFLSWSKNGTLVWSAEKLGLLILVLLIVMRV